MTLRRLSGALLLVAILMSWSIQCTPPEGPMDYSFIHDPLARWQAYKLSSYTIDQERDCFCPNGGVHVRLTIVDDRIVNAVKVSDGSRLPEATWGGYKTVNELFAYVQSVDPDSVAEFHVEYDDKYGYPSFVYLDYSRAIADEELGYRTNNLVRTNLH